MKQNRSPQPITISIKNRFEVLQAQDPCALQPQENIIENIKKKNDLLRKKASRQPTPLTTSPITMNKNNDTRTSTSPAVPTKKTTPQPTIPLKNQTHKGLPSSHPAEDQADPRIGKRGQAAPNQHNTPRPKRHDSPHGKFPQNREPSKFNSIQNLNDYANARKILTAANTAYFTYTPKPQKPHTYLLTALQKQKYWKT